MTDARLARFAIELGIVELDYAGPVTEMSLAHMWEDEGFNGGDYVLEGGYRTLVDHLATGLDVRLGQPVVAIAQDDAGVRVTTESGEVFPGSHVVVTVPLGVLKAERIAFDPPLPEAKQAALGRLDMGNLEKIVLVWDEAFWDPSVESLLYLADPPGEVPVFIDLTEFAGAPTLACLYGGTWSREVQATLGDEELVARATAALEDAMGMTVPTPVATEVTHWTTDPFAGGSYSYVAVGASPADYDAVAAPFERVRFAGEATQFDHVGTVHAAMMSGSARRTGSPPARPSKDSEMLRSVPVGSGETARRGCHTSPSSHALLRR